MSEKDIFGQERKTDTKGLEQAGEARREELQKDFEAIETKTPEKSPEDLHREAFEKAKSIEKAHEKQEHTQEHTQEKEQLAKGPRSKKLEASYNETMDEVRTHMSAPSRAFSKFIHNKAVDNVSGFLGATVARPNAIMSGAVFAFVLTLAIYLLAKNLGYPLSGFETIGAFIAGWVLGICYDFIKVMVTGRK